MRKRQSKHARALERFKQMFRRQAMPLTIQRRQILEVLLGRTDHPSADQVFEAVQARLPGISRTTVYRVLNTLVRLGVIRMVCNPGASVRFDPKLEQHHHLVCLYCGKMSDWDDPRLNHLPLPTRRRTDFKIVDYTVHFRGTCGDCMKKAKAAHRTKAAPRFRPRQVRARSS
jgi:Fur family peroxide stress response transcriptional regulator